MLRVTIEPVPRPVLRAAVVVLALASVVYSNTRAADERRPSAPAVPGPIVPIGIGFKLGPGPDNIGGHPTAAFDGTNFMAVYFNGGPYASRVTPNGVLLDPDGLPVGPAGGTAPSIAFGGTNYLVVWQDAGQIRAARLTPQGVVLDSPPLTLVAGPIDPPRSVAIAFDGTNFLSPGD